jgi:hypothetical protein
MMRILLVDDHAIMPTLFRETTRRLSEQLSCPAYTHFALRREECHRAPHIQFNCRIVAINTPNDLTSKARFRSGRWA